MDCSDTISLFKVVGQKDRVRITVGPYVSQLTRGLQSVALKVLSLTAARCPHGKRNEGAVGHIISLPRCFVLQKWALPNFQAD